MEPAVIDHVNIVVTDMERSIEFYRDVVGLQAGFEGVLEGEWIDRVTGLQDVKARCVFMESPDFPVRIELLRFEGATRAGMDVNSLPNVPGIRHLAFRVPDMDTFCARLHAAGVETVSGPVSVPFPLPGGRRKRLCYFFDPDGVLLEAAEYRVVSGW